MNLDHASYVYTLGVVLDAAVKAYRDCEDTVYNNIKPNNGLSMVKSGASNALYSSYISSDGGGSSSGIKSGKIESKRSIWNMISDNDPRKIS